MYAPVNGTALSNTADVTSDYCVRLKETFKQNNFSMYSFKNDNPFVENIPHVCYAIYPYTNCTWPVTAVSGVTSTMEDWTMSLSSHMYFTDV